MVVMRKGVSLRVESTMSGNYPRGIEPEHNDVEC